MNDETTTDTLAEIEGQAEQPQPVQVREGRWRTRGGEIRHVTRTPGDHDLCDRFPWWDEKVRNTWRDDGRYTHERQSVFDLVEYLGTIEPQPEQAITPDDVAAEALAGVWDQGKAEREIAELQAQVAFLKNRELTLGTRLEEEKAVSAKRLEQVEELRSEVSYVQGLLDESRKAVNSEARDKADLQHRLETVAAEWAQQCDTIQGLQQQLEAVKAELVRQCENSRRLQIELDAREQVPQAGSDRFEEGWDKGSARAVETIAEWLEPIRTLIDAADNLEETNRANCLAADIMQNLPHIMRTLTGLTDED